jgi:hypothetical protein
MILRTENDQAPLSFSLPSLFSEYGFDQDTHDLIRRKVTEDDDRREGTVTPYEEVSKARDMVPTVKSRDMREKNGTFKVDCSKSFASDSCKKAVDRTTITSI